MPSKIDLQQDESKDAAVVEEKNEDGKLITKTAAEDEEITTIDRSTYIKMF